MCQGLKGIIYTDTTIAGVKSAAGNRVAHVYVTGLFYVRIYTFLLPGLWGAIAYTLRQRLVNEQNHKVEEVYV